MKPNERQLAAGRAFGEALVNLLFDLCDELLRAASPPTPVEEARTKLSEPDLEPILITTRQAAKLLSVSDRTLWALTSPRGPIPSVKIGRATRYSLTKLKEFQQETLLKGQRPKQGN